MNGISDVLSCLTELMIILMTGVTPFIGQGMGEITMTGLVTADDGHQYGRHPQLGISHRVNGQDMVTENTH